MEVHHKNFLQQLSAHTLDAYLLPSQDEWGNEEVAIERNRLAHITSFTGSAGFAVVGGPTFPSAFFTDGRYTLQAKLQVPKIFEKHDLSESNIISFLTKHFTNKKVGFDPLVMRYKMIEKLKAQCPQITFYPIADLLPIPLVESNPLLLEVPLSHAGLSFTQKKEAIYQALGKNFRYAMLADTAVVTWLLNLRDLSNNTSSLALEAFLLLDFEGPDLLIADKSYPLPSSLAFKQLKIAQALQYMQEHIATTASIFLSHDVPYAVGDLYRQKVSDNTDLIPLLLCLKNESELQSMRLANLIDSKILTLFLAWLRDNYHGLNEYTLAEKLNTFRDNSTYFIKNSFSPIVGMGSNGAIIHYHAQANTAQAIDTNALLLIDSGGHYRFGTSDVTRTIKLGVATQFEKQLFTAVLRGMIALFLLRFNEKTGKELDAIARKPLQDIGYDYPHSTGHGVGFAINVHEGPIRLSALYDKPLAVGSIVSIEPGVYLEGQFGIRIENLAEIRLDDTGKKYFSTLTFVPIDEGLIDHGALEIQEQEWLRWYQAQSLALLAPSSA